MERRNVIGGGLAAGLTGLFAAGGAEAAVQKDDGEVVARSVDDLRKVFERQFSASDLGSSRPIAAIREQQRTFLRASHKYPDFIEVGIGIWEGVYDWHVKQLQPITAARLPDGRYTMTFMFTNLLLRPDLDVNYVGYGFDGDAPGRAAPVR